MRLALDTNILVYAEGVNGSTLGDVTLDLVERLPQESTVLPVQVLGELFNVLVRNAGYSREEARRILLIWRDAFPQAATSPSAVHMAAELATDHGLAI